ncbi:MAG: hypothetical protein OEY49_08665, partial [Candidatus Heimdallarchaeota archaeon]|nr:hypothetical protein [Candidatus Heimdallarchaeota archaeon]
MLFKNYKKAVSPVVAVVLLIALTVAGVAIVWTLMNQGSDEYTVQLTTQSANQDNIFNITIVVKLKSNVDVTITGATFTNGTVSNTVTALISPGSATANDETLITFAFAETSNLTGTYTLTVTTENDNGSQKLTDVT